ncbi:MAG: hypothetical protein ACOYXA_10335 [Bacteroidota bacterium]
MIRLVSITMLCLLATGVHAQKAAQALEGDHTLKERYGIMKENSQTFQDYKVIKEYILDGFWKITLDSVSALERSLAEAEARINTLEGQMKTMEARMAQNDAAMKEMEFDSSHVTVLGISFSKALFLIITGCTMAGLLVLWGSTAGVVRLLQKSVKEKDLSLFGLSAEFDDFRKKALEKEVKLSRELQNERNKLAELKAVR